MTPTLSGLVVFARHLQDARFVNEHAVSKLMTLTNFVGMPLCRNGPTEPTSGQIRTSTRSEPMDPVDLRRHPGAFARPAVVHRTTLLVRRVVRAGGAHSLNSRILSVTTCSLLSRRAQGPLARLEPKTIMHGAPRSLCSSP